MSLRHDSEVLRSVSNADAPVARVPDEILHDIFCCCTEWSNQYSLAYSQVCRYWRNLAVHSPQLWTLISFTNRSSPTMMHTFLARSSDLPIHVKFVQYGVASTSPGDLRLKAQMLSEHSHRIFEFEATNIHQPQMLALRPYFMAPAPRLRSLRLRGYGHPFSSPPLLFQNTIPSLCVVSMHNITTRWLSCKGVTELDLHSHLAPSVSALLRTLNDCPALTHLRLHFRSPIMGTVGSDIPQPVEVVDLSNLRQLSLASFEHRDVVRILSYISFPVTTHVNLRFQAARRDPLEILQNNPSLRAVVSHVKEVSLDMRCSYGWSCAIGLECGSSLSVKWEWDWTDELIDDRDFLLHMGFAAIPFPQLQRVNVHVSSFQLFEHEWFSFLSHIPSVPYLDLSMYESQIVPLFDALSLQTNPTSDDPAMPVCTGITSLAVSVFDDSRDENLEHLTTCCEARARMHAPLRRLAIVINSGRSFPPALLTRLEAVVDEALIIVPSEHLLALDGR